MTDKELDVIEEQEDTCDCETYDSKWEYIFKSIVAIGVCAVAAYLESGYPLFALILLF